MTHRSHLAIARFLVLALMFRVGLGFGHGPMVAPAPDLMLQGYCGSVSDSGESDVVYQGCPICHALSYQADIDQGLVSTSTVSDPASSSDAGRIAGDREPAISLHGIIPPTRAPPAAGNA